jgi:hypothetical protein
LIYKLTIRTKYILFYGKLADNLSRVKTQESALIAGSCGLTNSLSNIKELAAKGVGAIVIKSLFEEQIHIEAEKVIKNDNGKVKYF